MESSWDEYELGIKESATEVAAPFLIYVNLIEVRILATNLIFSLANKVVYTKGSPSIKFRTTRPPYYSE